MNRTDRGSRLTALATACLILGACGFDGLLDVERPDVVTPDDISGPRGAELYAAGALGQFGMTFGGQVLYSGLVSDEFYYSGVFPQQRDLDIRSADERNSTIPGIYRALHEARVGLENAADLVQDFLPGDPLTAEMLGLAGFTYVFFGEQFCSGVPFGRTLPTGEATPGEQQSTDQTFAIALEHFDRATAATAGSVDLTHLAAVGAARALLDLGRYSEAAARAASVPTDWVYLIRFKGGAAGSQANPVFSLNRIAGNWSLSDLEGGNGMPFRSANDPRLGWFHTAGRTGSNNESLLYEQTKYDSYDDDIVLADGFEARLIEAEAALQADDVPLMLTRLNDLRATIPLVDLTDPGTFDARVDLLFTERAWWMFGTSHRLGDLRRLVRQYGRDPETVYPTGVYHGGGVYGTDVNIVIPDDENANPNYSGCFDRGA